MEIKNLLLGLIAFFLFVNILLMSNDTGAAIAIALQEWEEADITTGNITMTVLQPVDFLTNQTVRVFDLDIISPNSIKLGIVDGVTFATISTSNLTSTSRNITRFFTNIDSDFVLNNDYNGTSFLANVNLDLSPNSSSFISASDGEFNALTLNKWNLNHEDRYLNGLVGLFGNLEIRTTIDNADSSLGGNSSNTIKLGFYKNITSGDEISVFGYNGRVDIMTLNMENITSIKNHFFDNSTYFNQTYTNTVPKTSPATDPNRIALFARDDDNLYIKRTNGEIKRVSVVGSGSSVFDEEVKFNNHTTFYGNVVLDNSIYNGGSVGYACIDAAGRLFKSVTPCHITSQTFQVATIENTTLGDET